MHDVVVLTEDRALADVIAPQLTNLGRDCRWVAGPPGGADIEFAVVDLAMDGGADLVTGLTAAGSTVVAIAPDARAADELASAAPGAVVVVEPFSIVELIDALHTLDPDRADGTGGDGTGGDGTVIDLRRHVVDDRPWWATR